MKLRAGVADENISNVLEINTIAPILLTQRLLKKKILVNGASIVFISSIGGVFTTTPGNAMYGVSKNALHAFMKSVAIEFASKRIRSNSINPGRVSTDFINKFALSEEDLKRDIESYPLKRYGTPEEVAYCAIYLLSNAADWVTGHAFVIDGGKTLY